MNVEVTFRNMDPSEAVEAEVRRRALALARIQSTPTGCRVVIEAPHKHHRHGNLYSAHIELTGLSAPVEQADADVYLAVRDAFRVARRQLVDAGRERRGVSAPA